MFGNLPKAEALASKIYYNIQSNKFWKKLDSLALQFYREVMVDGSGKVTRELTRALIKFVNEKNLTNKTSVNHINDKWENIHREYDSYDLNKMLQEQLDIMFPIKRQTAMTLDIHKSNFDENHLNSNVR